MGAEKANGLQFPLPTSSCTTRTASPVPGFSRIQWPCCTLSSGLRRDLVMKFLECAMTHATRRKAMQGTARPPLLTSRGFTYTCAGEPVLTTRTKTPPRGQQSDGQKPSLTTLRGSTAHGVAPPARPDRPQRNGQTSLVSATVLVWPLADHYIVVSWT